MGVKLADDQDLNNLEDYKDADLVKAIAECNLYIQSGAKIVIPDPKNKRQIVADTTALEVVMDYVNHDTVSREALLEKLFQLFQTILNNENSFLTKQDLETIGFGMNLLQSILTENTLFVPYISKSTFEVNNIFSSGKIEEHDTLGLIHKIILEDQKLFVVFDFNCGEWFHLTEQQMSNLHEVEGEE